MAEVSYPDTYGYYRLRVVPTLDQVMGAKRNERRLPMPDRAAKWLANSWYRSLLLDAGKQFEEVEGAAAMYRESGAQLPEAAARLRSSDLGRDPAFDRINEQNDKLKENEAYELATIMKQDGRKRQTAEARRDQLRLSYGPNQMNSVIAAHHDELEKSSIPHVMPAPRLPPHVKAWKAPPPRYIAAGQLQAPSFPTYEMLNNENADIKIGVTYEQAMTYERMRSELVEPTWSS